MLKCASFFAGVGGIDLGFEQAGFETIYANEFDEYATFPSPRIISSSYIRYFTAI